MATDGGQTTGPEIIEVSGVRIPLDASVMSQKIQLVLRSGRYDQDRARLVPLTLEDGERVLDVGAGMGFISAVAAQPGKAELVVAVEGDPGVIPLIETVHRLNRVSCVVRNAIVVAHKTADTAPFYVHHDLWASSFMPLKPANTLKIVQVPVVTFGELIAQYSPTLLMLDFEVFRELVPSFESPQTDVFGDIDFTAVRKVQLMFKTKVVGPVGMRRAFEVLTAQGFAYDPAFSSGNIVLMRRIEPGAA